MNAAAKTRVNRELFPLLTKMTKWLTKNGLLNAGFAIRRSRTVMKLLPTSTKHEHKYVLPVVAAVEHFTSR